MGDIDYMTPYLDGCVSTVCHSRWAEEECNGQMGNNYCTLENINCINGLRPQLLTYLFIVYYFFFFLQWLAI